MTKVSPRFSATVPRRPGTQECRKLEDEERSRSELSDRFLRQRNALFFHGIIVHILLPAGRCGFSDFGNRRSAIVRNFPDGYLSVVQRESFYVCQIVTSG